MAEPDVTLTDYLLTLESLLFVVLLWRGRGGQDGPGELRFWFIVYFASAAVASACGGTVHGFFPGHESQGHAILWTITLLAVGISTLALWAIGARLLFSQRVARWVLVAAGVQAALYAAVVLVVTQDFLVAIVDHLPAVLFLLVALAVAYRREKNVGALVAAGGLILTLVAAGLQQLQIGIHPLYFNHNAVFHVVQAGALLLFFLGGRRLVDTEIGAEASSPNSNAANVSQRAAVQ